MHPENERIRRSIIMAAEHMNRTVRGESSANYAAWAAEIDVVLASVETPDPVRPFSEVGLIFRENLGDRRNFHSFFKKRELNSPLRKFVPKRNCRIRPRRLTKGEPQMNTLTRSRIYLPMAAMILTAALVVTATAQKQESHR